MPNTKVNAIILTVALGAATTGAIIAGRKVCKKIEHTSAKIHAFKSVAEIIVKGEYSDQYTQDDIKRDFEFYRMTYRLKK